MRVLWLLALLSSSTALPALCPLSAALSCCQLRTVLPIPLVFRPKTRLSRRPFVMAAVELGEILGISKDQKGWKEKDETHVKAYMGQMLLDPEIGPSDGMTCEFGLVTKDGLE
ncbi:hypothetical protein V6N13_094672 [Hibiscus sabdariffa]